jgi:hypothetical protein
MDERAGYDRAEDVAAYVATLLPVQQQAIATAQLAGCRFERREVTRDLGWSIRRSSDRYIDTTVYDVSLPDGAYIGMFEDIYEGALMCLNWMNTTHGVPTENLFQLREDNEPPERA